MIKDTRTEAVKMQHVLFQQLGTLYRTRANLNNLRIGLAPYSREADTLDDAQLVINKLIREARTAMYFLPSKKNLAKAKDATKSSSV